MSPVRGALKGRGIYLTQRELGIIKQNIPFLATMKEISPREKAVFDKLQRKINDLDRKRRKTEDFWLTAQNAKLLIAWKEAALEGKVTRQMGKKGLAGIEYELIAKKWNDIFKEMPSTGEITSALEELRKRNINLDQANVSVFKTRQLLYLTDRDKRIIELCSRGLTYRKMSEELNLSKGTIEDRIRYLRRAGYKL